MKSGRRLARDLAFHTLFEMEARSGRALEDALALRVEAVEEENGEAVGRRAIDFARSLVAGALQERAGIDAQIQAAAPTFPVDQLPTTDRVALELAIFELRFAGTAPERVVINEAVETAKRYGGENSGRFVNGVLGTIAERFHREASRASRESPEGERHRQQESAGGA